MIDLCSEFAAAKAAMTTAHRDRLRGLGVEAHLVDARCPLIGTARVRFDGDCFEPAPDDGERAVIIAARGDGDTIGTEHEDPIRAAVMGQNLLDLLAFTTTRPDRWATRLGAVDSLGFMSPQIMLGDDATDNAVWFWPSPLAWLTAGGDGICILSRDPMIVRDIVMSARRPYAEDPALAARLSAIAARPLPVPKFTVMSRSRFYDLALGIKPAAALEAA